MRLKLITLWFLLPIMCNAQNPTPFKGSTTLDKFGTPEHWDSSYLRHWVDSTGTLPPNVDLSSLQLSSTYQITDFWKWADTVQPVRQEFLIKRKKKK